MPVLGVAIVTGASKGIGAAIAKRLARDGFAVIVNFAGDEAPAKAVAGDVEAAGGRAIAIKADISDSAAVAALFDQAAEFGELKALVNNAGIMKLSPLAETDDAAFDRNLAVNLKGPFLCLREAARRFGAGGRVVNFSSSVVGLYPPTYAAYAAAKGGIEAMTHIAAKELGPKGITVNAVAPGPVATALFLDGKSDEQVAQAAKMNPMGRIAEPHDIASVVSFLLGEDGGWVNGQVLRANGGVV